jgi:DNA polymerase-3 subunit delta
MYLFYGDSNYLINLEINKVLKEHNIYPIIVSSFDGETDSLKDIILGANTLSLLSDKQAIIINNASFLGSTSYDIDDSVYEYIKNPNPDTLLFFITNKLDERKKIVKALKKHALVKEFINNEVNINIVKSMFDNYDINNDDINYFIKRVGNNLDILNNEAIKLKHYKIDDKVITRGNIEEATIQVVDTNLFNLVDNIIAKNKVDALISYEEMIKLGEEPIKIIITLANQIRLIYQSKKLLQKGYSEKDIARMLKVHPYRVKTSLIKGRLISEDKLINYLHALANLDIDIKTGEENPKTGLELFILSI